MARALLANWELKALSLIVAVVVWFLVVNADRSQIAFAAPVEYVGLAQSMVLVGDRRDAVDVEVEAARWAVARLTPAAMRVRVDLGSLREGDNIVHLQAEHVDAPAGVTVTRITPAWLHVTLASASVRSLRVVPHIRGVPAPAHAVHRVIVDPPNVPVKGPRTTMETRATVDALPVDVSGSRQPVTQTVGLALPEAMYPTTQSTVQVTVDIRPEDSMRQRRGGSPRR